MPTIDLTPDLPFNSVLVLGLKPKDASVFKEALEALNNARVNAQILDGCVVAGLEHLATAAKLAAASLRSGRNLARSPATELLLYASASRQIKEAIRKLGVNQSSRCWVLVAIDSPGASPQKASEIFLSYGVADDSVIDLLPAKKARIMDLFGISDQEVAYTQTLHDSVESAIKALVIERVALSEFCR